MKLAASNVDLGVWGGVTVVTVPVGVMLVATDLVGVIDEFVVVLPVADVVEIGIAVVMFRGGATDVVSLLAHFSVSFNTTQLVMS